MITAITITGLLVLGICFMRLLGVLHREGPYDAAAARAVRSASLIPVFSTVGLLIVCVVAMGLLPGATVFLTASVAVIALAGCIWSVERSITAVRATRAEREADAG